MMDLNEKLEAAFTVSILWGKLCEIWSKIDYEKEEENTPMLYDLIHNKNFSKYPLLLEM